MANAGAAGEIHAWGGPGFRAEEFEKAETYARDLKRHAAAQSRKATLGAVTTMGRTQGQGGKMCKTIAMYNFKGGVGKTTNTVNLAGAMSKQGKRVVIIDADPQCNTTNFFMPPVRVDEERRNEEEANAAGNGRDVNGAIEEFPMPVHDNNEGDAGAIDLHFLKQVNARMYNAGISDIYEVLEPVFSGKKDDEPAPPSKLLTAESIPNVFILPGNPNITKLEAKLNLAAALPEKACVYIGAFRQMCIGISQATDADFILVDLGPSMSTLNRTFIFSCDFILPPVFPDFFSLSSMATLLGDMVPMMLEEHERNLAQEPTRLTFQQKALGFAFNKKFPRILPFIVTNFTFIHGRVEKSAAKWIESMKQFVDPQNDYIADKRVYDLFIKAQGDKMVIPFAPFNNKLTKWSHVFGLPAVLLDEPIFRNIIYPDEKTQAQSLGSAEPQFRGYQPYWLKSEQLLQKYKTLADFLDSLSLE